MDYQEQLETLGLKGLTLSYALRCIDQYENRRVVPIASDDREAVGAEIYSRVQLVPQHNRALIDVLSLIFPAQPWELL